jgi:antitoxin (DNA-binding transcriptional repressor) of toxin-antitoxin stability system
MKEMLITVTEAARNFADCVNRVHYQNVTFVLLKNGVPFARLTPDHQKVCTGSDLSKLLAATQLKESEAKTWRRDLKTARKSLKAPSDKWRIPVKKCFRANESQAVFVSMKALGRKGRPFFRRV